MAFKLRAPYHDSFCVFIILLLLHGPFLPFTSAQVISPAVQAQPKILQVLVPNRTIFQDFVDCSNGPRAVTGFCIDVFNYAISILVPKPTWTEINYTCYYFGSSRTYDDMISEFSKSSSNYDALVGDITISKARLRKVIFTQPYLDIGIVLLIPAVGVFQQFPTLFLAPFTPWAWALVIASILVTSASMLLIEYNEHQRVPTPSEQRVQTESCPLEVHQSAPSPSEHQRVSTPSEQRVQTQSSRLELQRVQTHELSPSEQQRVQTLLSSFEQQRAPTPLEKRVQTQPCPSKHQRVQTDLSPLECQRVSTPSEKRVQTQSSTSKHQRVPTLSEKRAQTHSSLSVHQRVQTHLHRSAHQRDPTELSPSEHQRDIPKQSSIAFIIFRCFTSVLLFFRQDVVTSPRSKIIMIAWTVFVLVVGSSYTASLSSILTVDKLSADIKSIDDLKSKSLRVGVLAMSFVKDYLKERQNITNTMDLHSENDYVNALRTRQAAAIAGESAYVSLFLAEQPASNCKFLVSPKLTNDGLAFAFRDENLVSAFSVAILNLSESGQLRRLKDGWKLADVRCASQIQSTQLNLKSVVGPFILLVIVVSICLIFLEGKKIRIWVRPPAGQIRKTHESDSEDAYIQQPGCMSRSSSFVRL